METQEGDRFLYKIHKVILEMILIDGIESIKVIKFPLGSGWNYVGEVCLGYGWTDRNADPKMFEYLGNFRKSQHFETLYTKLCYQE